MDITRIDLGLLAGEMRKYECMWIAISADNEIVSSGKTYAEVIEKVQNQNEVILFKVPPLDYALAP